MRIDKTNPGGKREGEARLGGGNTCKFAFVVDMTARLTQQLCSCRRAVKCGGAVRLIAVDYSLKLVWSVVIIHVRTMCKEGECKKPRHTGATSG